MINSVKCQEENYPVVDWFKYIYHLKPMKIIKLINCRLTQAYDKLYVYKL